MKVNTLKIPGLLLFVFVTWVVTFPPLHSQSSHKSIEKLWEHLDVASKYHTGLSIYDPENNKPVFTYRDDNFFTPGSNVKILTMYAALSYLGETIPAAYYHIHGDTIVVWGGGDPGTFYPDIKKESSFVDFLRATDKHIVFSDHHFRTDRFGSGWAWDDHRFSYQPERNAFPIYGNRLWIERYQDSIVITPSYFDLVFKAIKGSVPNATRNEWGTEYVFVYNPRLARSSATIPLSLYENDVRFIWQEATGKQITFKDYPIVKNASFIAESNRDTLLHRMMQESDNFIGEQLLLASSLAAIDSMDEATIIKKTLAGPLASITDSILWIDGSGLSRYNLMTPRAATIVLNKILNEKGLDYVKAIFPAGGKSGTLKWSFGGEKDKPYIFAKTGSMKSTYCLSGYLLTKSGKVLIFSWMNNHFRSQPSEVREAMEKVFVYLRDHY